jgi:hypothetical protein
MVIHGEYVLTDEDVRTQKMRALYAHDEAQKHLDRLLADAKVISGRLYKVAHMLGGLETEPESPLTSESPLLTLPKTEYEEALNLATIKALANSIALARKELADAADVKRKVGV